MLSISLGSLSLLSFFATTQQLTAAAIRARVYFLAEGVQGEEHHHRFTPKGRWWLLSNGKGASNAFPDAISFLDQIGVSDDDVVKAFDKKFWRRTVEDLFPQLICHKWGGNFLWVSVDHIPGSLNDEGKYDNEGDRPDWHNIVTTEMKYPSAALLRSIDHGANIMATLSSIWEEDILVNALLGRTALTRAAMKEDLAKKTPTLSAIAMKMSGTGGGDGDDGDDEEEDEEEDEDEHMRPQGIAVANAASRDTSSAGTSGVGGGAADASAAGRTGNADAVQPDAPLGRDGIVGKVEALTESFKSLRVSKSKKNFNKKEKKAIGYLHYETAQILRQGGDEIIITSKDGGKPLHFVRIAKSLGGTSKSTISRENICPAQEVLGSLFRDCLSYSYNSKAICRGRGYATEAHR